MGNESRPGQSPDRGRRRRHEACPVHNCTPTACSVQHVKARGRDLPASKSRFQPERPSAISRASRSSYRPEHCASRHPAPRRDATIEGGLVKSRYTRTLAVVAAGAAALTACGGGGKSSGSGSSGGSNAATSAAPTLTGSAVNVLSIYPDGTNGANFPEVAVAAQAYQDYINSNGGINGHPLKVTVCND